MCVLTGQCWAEIKWSGQVCAAMNSVRDRRGVCTKNAGGGVCLRGQRYY